MSTIILPQQLYSGTQTSSSLPWQTGASTLTVTGAMSAADAVNTANTGTLRVQASYDGTTWQDVAATPWQGGTLKDGVTPNYPSIPWQTSNVPKAIRCAFDLAQPLSVGLGASMA